MEFDSPEFQHELYENYRSLRDRDPVHFHTDATGTPCCSLFRYRDVLAALRNPLLGVTRPPPGVVQDLRRRRNPDLVNMGIYWDNVISSQDPPDQTRLRNLVNRAFTPRAAERLRGPITELTQEILDDAAQAGTFDLIRDVAVPLPLRVIAELLGVPHADRSRLHQLADDFNPIMDRTLWSSRLRSAAAALTELSDYFRGLIARSRRRPGDDLVSSMVSARDERDALTDDEIVATSVFLLVAGHETVTNLIGNGILQLLRHPTERARLAADPNLAPRAVEELLRCESPVQRTLRVALEDMEIDGRRVPRGMVVDLVMGSANRDPEAFPDPERLDLGRHPNRHLAFGNAVHFCIGAALARLEGRIALPAILQRFPGLKQTDEEVRWRPGSVFRGLVSLRLAC